MFKPTDLLQHLIKVVTNKPRDYDITIKLMMMMIMRIIRAYNYERNKYNLTEAKRDPLHVAIVTIVTRCKQSA